MINIDFTIRVLCQILLSKIYQLAFFFFLYIYIQEQDYVMHIAFSFAITRREGMDQG